MAWNDRTICISTCIFVCIYLNLISHRTSGLPSYSTGRVAPRWDARASELLADVTLTVHDQAFDTMAKITANMPNMTAVCAKTTTRINPPIVSIMRFCSHW
jgi:hypothetical protein